MPEVVLRVAMPCDGCKGAVERVLKRTQGVESFDIDMNEQKVVVQGQLDPAQLVEVVSKTGKKTEIWQ